MLHLDEANIPVPPGRRKLPTVLSTRHLAGYLGVSEDEVISWCRSGELPSRRLGIRHFVSRDAFVDWLESAFLDPDDTGERGAGGTS